MKEAKSLLKPRPYYAINQTVISYSIRKDSFKRASRIGAQVFHNPSQWWQKAVKVDLFNFDSASLCSYVSKSL